MIVLVFNIDPNRIYFNIRPPLTIKRVDGFSI